MDLDFYMAWGNPQSLADSLGRYPGLCFTIVLSPGDETLLLSELRNDTTADAVIVGSLTDLPEVFAESGVVDPAAVAQLVSGTADQLLVTQTIVDGQRVWTTTTTPELAPDPLQPTE